MGFTYAERAFAYIKKGAKEKAIADLNCDITLSHNFVSYMRSARAYTAMGNHLKEIDEYGKALKLEPYQYCIYIARAHSYSNISRFNDALRDCDTAISMIPKNVQRCQYASLYAERALVYLKQNHVQQALTDCNRGIAFEPEIEAQRAKPIKKRMIGVVASLDGIARAYRVRALILWKQGRSEDALPDLNKAVGLEPNQAYDFALRAAVFNDLGMQDKAAADMQRAKKLDPEISMPTKGKIPIRGPAPIAIFDAKRSRHLFQLFYCPCA